MSENKEMKDAVKEPARAERKAPVMLPVYPEIKKQYESAGEELRLLLMELTITRALKDKNLKKKLAATYDNRRMDDGRVVHLVGYYSVDQLSEREADDLICSGEAADAIDRMWILDKYSELAAMLK